MLLLVLLLLLLLLLLLVVVVVVSLSGCWARVRSEDERMSDDSDNPLSRPDDDAPLFLEDSNKRGSPCSSSGENEMMASPCAALRSFNTPSLSTPALTGVTHDPSNPSLRIFINGEGGLMEGRGRRGLGVEGGLLG